MMSVGETRLLGKVTGGDSVNRTDERFAIHGTDLGIMWDAGGGRVFVMFGDTYGNGWGGHGAGPDHADWRCNTLLASATRDLEPDGLVLDRGLCRVRGGGASQAIPSMRANLPRLHFPEHTLIPNSGITVDGVHYVHWMSVLIWRGPGRWRTFQAGIARSDDDARSWTKPLAGRWWNLDGANRFQIGAFARAADWVYLFGTTNGRFGPAYLARVGPDAVDRVAAYRYWNGTAWVPRPDAATPVISGPVGEMSVAYHRGVGRWLAMHLDEERSMIVLRSAEDVTGPWDEGVPVASAAEYPALYGGYLHPWHLDSDRIYWLMSRWAPYNVYLMSTTLNAGTGTPE